MKTIVVQIGNSDDKLSQLQCSIFADRTDKAILRRSNRIHFFSTSPNTEAWQNAAWIFDIHENASCGLIGDLKELRLLFEQDSIAWTEGKTTLIEKDTGFIGGG